MKTTLILLSLLIGILNGIRFEIKPKALENTASEKIFTGNQHTPADQQTLWDNELLAKADSSNHYIYIVSKHDFVCNNQLLSENRVEIIRNYSTYRIVDKNSVNEGTGNCIAGYLDTKNLNLI